MRGRNVDRMDGAKVTSSAAPYQRGHFDILLRHFRLLRICLWHFSQIAKVRLPILREFIQDTSHPVAVYSNKIPNQNLVALCFKKGLKYLILVSEFRWGPWSEYSACSATCGPAVRCRTRECFNTLNQVVDDLKCGKGLSVDCIRCNNKDCPRKGRCTGMGDPHETTFDGTRYDFQGWLAQYKIFPVGRQV